MSYSGAGSSSYPLTQEHDSLSALSNDPQKRQCSLGHKGDDNNNLPQPYDQADKVLRLEWEIDRLCSENASLRQSLEIAIAERNEALCHITTQDAELAERRLWSYGAQEQLYTQGI